MNEPSFSNKLVAAVTQGVNRRQATCKARFGRLQLLPVREKLVIVQTLALLVSAAAAASCSKNGNDRARDDYKGVGEALDLADSTRARGASAPQRPASAQVPGVDVSKLDDAGKRRFAKLLDALPSPCGKAHSLRTSLSKDTACKRALFAARYVVMLVGADVEELSIRAAYDGRYRNDERHEFRVAAAPHFGEVGAPVVIVEFLDYG